MNEINKPGKYEEARAMKVAEARLEADESAALARHQTLLEQLRAKAPSGVYMGKVEAVPVPETLYKSRTVTRGPKVQRYSADGKTLIKTYACFLDAVRDKDLEVEDLAPTTNAMKDAIKARTLYKGFRWAALDREAADDTAQDIGDTVESHTISHGVVAGLNLDRTRIERVFADQKDAAEELRLKGLASVSQALKQAGSNNPRMTRGMYLRYWRDCPVEMRDEFLSRGGVLPEPRKRANAVEVVATNVVTGDVRKFSSVAAAQAALKVGRATIFECAMQGYALPSGIKLSVVR